LSDGGQLQEVVIAKPASYNLWGWLNVRNKAMDSWLPQPVRRYVAEFDTADVGATDSEMLRAVNKSSNSALLPTAWCIFRNTWLHQPTQNIQIKM